MKALIDAAVIVVFVVSSATAIADENPFGLPAPKDDNHPGAVMLHGGGNGLASNASDQDIVRREFIRLARRRYGDRAKILLLPSGNIEQNWMA